MQQGLTINAYQDGNRLIISFENAPGSLQTAILGLLGGIVAQPVDGLAPVSEPDYDKGYKDMAQEIDKLETASKVTTSAQKAETPVVTDMPKAETKPTATPATQENQTTEKPTEKPAENKPENNGDKKPEKKDATQPKATKRVFFEGEYKDMSPAEAVAKDKLKALSIFYNKRTERPYNNSVMKTEMKNASLEYVRKVTENMSKVQSALDWLFDNYREGTCEALKNMRYEPTKAGIKELCNHESVDLCRTTITMLFEKMIREI